MIEYGMMFTAEQIQELAWGVVGLVGISFIVSLISSIRHGHALNWRDWRIGLGIPFVGIAIFGISTVNPTFGEGLTLLATLAVALVALMSLQQTADLEARRAKESQCNGIRDWVYEALRLKVVFSVPTEGFEHMTLVSKDWLTQREVDKRLFVAKKAQVIYEAERLDSELPKSSGIKAPIERLAWLFEHENISDAKVQQEIESNCIAAVKAINDFRARIKL